MTVAVAVVAAKTSTGNQDITTPDLGGATPKAVLFLYSRANADGVVNIDSGPSHGITDGTNQFASAGFIRHGATGSSVTTNGHVSKTDKCLCALAYNGSAIVVHSEAAFVAFIANGVTVNWTTMAAPSGWLVTALFFEGSDWTVAVGNSVASFVGTAVALPFKPDALIVSSALDTATGTIATDRAMTSLGFAAWPAGVGQNAMTQQFSWFLTRQLYDGAATGLDIVSSVFRGSSTYSVTATQDASGFTLHTGSGAPATEKYGYLALKYTGVGTLKVGTIALTAASGNQAYTGFGGQPGPWVLWLLRENQATTGGFDYRLGVSAMTAAKSGGYAIGGLSDGNNVNASHPMVVHETANQDTITMLDNAGLVNITATFVSFDADGLTLNYTVPPVFHPEIGPGFGGMIWMYLTPVFPGGELVQAWVED